MKSAKVTLRTCECVIYDYKFLQCLFYIAGQRKYTPLGFLPQNAAADGTSCQSTKQQVRV